MIVKLLEIRDRGTFLPMFAFDCVASNAEQHYLLRRAGYGDAFRLIMFGYVEGSRPANYDQHSWGDRTKAVAHKYIEEHWDELEDGDVIDVEFILGESTEKKLSERITA